MLPGKLEISSTQGMMVGRVWFDAQASWEPLEDLYFDEAIGELSFTRPGANQAYRAACRATRWKGNSPNWADAITRRQPLPMPGPPPAPGRRR